VLIILFACSGVYASFPKSSDGLVQVPAGSGAAAAPAEQGRPGYLLVMEVRNGRVQLQAGAEIENYFESKHILAEDDWLLLLFDEESRVVGAQRINNPQRHSPILSSGQPLPFTAKVPRVARLSSIGVYDKYLQEQLRIFVDSSFRSRAAANRQAFLAHDRENRRLLMEEDRRRPGRALAALPLSARKEKPGFESLPEELQKRFLGEIALEIEQLEQFGAEAMNLRTSLVVEPAEAERAIRGSGPPARSVAAGSGYYELAGAFTLSGRVTDEDTGAPVSGAILSFSQYDASNKYIGSLGSSTTDASGSYSISADAGSVRITQNYSLVTGERYVPRTESVTVTGNTTYDFKAIPGIRLSGFLTNAQNQGVSGATIQAYAKDLQLNVTSSTSANGSYAATVPSDRPLRITISVPMPYVPPPAEIGMVLAEDTVRNYKVDTGWIVTGTVLGDGGTAVSGASVLLRQLAATTTGSPYGYANTNSSGKFTFVVARNLEPNWFVLAAYAKNYVLQSFGQEITGDVTCTIQLVRGISVSGIVRDSYEAVVRGARVRACRDGTFVTSALTDSNGSYKFDLPSGIYEFEALPPAGSSQAPAIVRNLSVDASITVDLILSPADGMLSVNLYFPSESIYSGFASKSLVRFELYQSGLTAYASSGSAGTGGLDPSRGLFFRPFSLYLKKGKYTLKAFLAGCRPQTLANVDVTEQTTIALNVPEPFLWAGVLRGADRAPLANTYVQSYTDLARENELLMTNSSGQFSILLTPNGFVKFYTNAGSSNILRTERLGDVTANRNEDVILDAFPSFTDSGSPLTQIYGVPDRYSRWNIVMIGDGYTGVNETFTDRNGNGIWDGVLYYDLDGNGVYNTGDRYQRYGVASAPVSGTNPTLQNEPFVDLNGDGVPNLSDQEQFGRNTLDTARSLFGQDEWKLHREAFNIFRIRLISRQAGHDVRDEDGKTVIERDTALGTYLHTPSRNYLFSANYTLISQYINQYVPECDTRIVMVNQPIRMGRVNSYMFQYGGEVPSLCNDYVVAHEMGHNVGLLADEYTEYQETYVGSESASRNVTSLTDIRYIPWKYLIPPEKEIPSVPGSGGIGLYEGAGYYTGGRYRPTEYCMMVSGNRYCPVCTVEIEARLTEITGVIPAARPLSPVSGAAGSSPEFKWEPLPGVPHYLLEIEKADGSEVAASYDIYDTAFVIPFSLKASEQYRWRIRPASASRWGGWSSWIYFRIESEITEPPPQILYLPHLALGGIYPEAEVFISNEDDSAVNATINFMDQQGQPMRVRYQGSLTSTIPSTLLPHSLARFQIEGEAQLQVGAGEIVIAGGTDPAKRSASLNYHVAIPGMAGTVSTSVDATTPESSYRVTFRNRMGDTLCGFAAHNASDTTISLEFQLYDSDGILITTVSPDEWTLTRKTQLARYIHEIFGAAYFQGGFTGTMVVREKNGGQFTAVGLEQRALPGNPSVAAIPVTPATIAEHAQIVLPHIAVGTAEHLGAGYNMRITATNTSWRDERGVWRFYENGPDGAAVPAAVKLTSTDSPVTSVTATIKGGGALCLEALGAENPQLTQALYCIYTPLGQPYGETSAGTALFYPRDVTNLVVVASYGLVVPGLAGDIALSTPAAEPTSNGILAVHSASGEYDPGVALVNTIQRDVNAALTLRIDGVTRATGNLTLKPGQHDAWYVWQQLDAVTDYTGTLEVAADGPLALLSLRQTNERAAGQATNHTLARMPGIRIPEENVTLTLHAMRVADLDTAPGTTTFTIKDANGAILSTTPGTNGEASVTLPRGIPVIINYVNSTVYPEWTLARHFLTGENQAVSDITTTATYTPTSSTHLYVIKINSIEGEPILSTRSTATSTVYHPHMLDKNDLQRILGADDGKIAKFAHPMGIIAYFDNPDNLSAPEGIHRTRDAIDSFTEQDRGTFQVAIQSAGSTIENRLACLLRNDRASNWRIIDAATSTITKSGVSFFPDTTYNGRPVTWDAIGKEVGQALFAWNDTIAPSEFAPGSEEQVGVSRVIFPALIQQTRQPLTYAGRTLLGAWMELPKGTTVWTVYPSQKSGTSHTLTYFAGREKSVNVWDVRFPLGLRGSDAIDVHQIPFLGSIWGTLNHLSGNALYVRNAGFSPMSLVIHPTFHMTVSYQRASLRVPGPGTNAADSTVKGCGGRI